MNWYIWLKCCLTQGGSLLTIVYLLIIKKQYSFNTDVWDVTLSKLATISITAAKSLVRRSIWGLPLVFHLFSRILDWLACLYFLIKTAQLGNGYGGSICSLSPACFPSTEAAWFLPNVLHLRPIVSTCFPFVFSSVPAPPRPSFMFLVFFFFFFRLSIVFAL